MNQTNNQQELNAMTTEELLTRLQGGENLPQHVAIIMDGNGRWAKKRFLPRVAGHRAGRHSVRRCVELCGRLGVKYLTLYTFSQENFNRPQAEVKALWHFLQETLLAEREELNKKNVRLVASGELDQLPEKAQKGLQAVIDSLASNTGLTLNLALAYGGRQEILRAAQGLYQRLQSGEITSVQVTEQDVAIGLYNYDIPDPDLLIRTSGEGRLSNFLLWQSAYSEFLITPVLWPDFRERDLLLAIADYLGRERRYGALPAAASSNDQDDVESLLDPNRWKRLLKGQS